MRSVLIFDRLEVNEVVCNAYWFDRCFFHILKIAFDVLERVVIAVVKKIQQLLKRLGIYPAPDGGLVMVLEGENIRKQDAKAFCRLSVFERDLDRAIQAVGIFFVFVFLVFKQVFQFVFLLFVFSWLCLAEYSVTLCTYQINAGIFLREAAEDVRRLITPEARRKPNGL